MSDWSSDVCSSDLRNRPLTLDGALAHLGDGEAALLVNAQSGRAAVQIPTRGLLLDDGSVERRVRLVRPMESTPMPLAAMSETQRSEEHTSELQSLMRNSHAVFCLNTDKQLPQRQTI